MKLSRRKWASAMATAAAAAALPEAAEPQQPQAQSQASADPDLQAAQAALQSSIATVRSLDLDISVEPAVHFAAKG